MHKLTLILILAASTLSQMQYQPSPPPIDGEGNLSPYNGVNTGSSNNMQYQISPAPIDGEGNLSPYITISSNNVISGGYNPAKICKCARAFSAYVNNLGVNAPNYQVLNCAIQVVNGNNYKILAYVNKKW